MWKKNRIVWLATIALCLCLTGCGSEKGMKNGYYTAEMKEYDYGWKEYVCIFVKNNTIVSIEFNAKNASGFIKAWDNAYMENMKPVSGTYPNEYTRLYGSRCWNPRILKKWMLSAEQRVPEGIFISW